MFDWSDVNDALVVATIIVVIVRILVVAGYGRGTSRLLTFYLPTGALLVFAIRAFVTRHVDGLATEDWVASLSWALVLVTQIVAAIHAWLPPSLRPQPDEVPVHDAKVLAKLDEMGEQITATGEAVDDLTEGRRDDGDAR